MRLRATVGLALLAAGCSGRLLGPDPPADRLALFEQVWREVDRHYSLFVVKGVNWDSVHDVHAPAASRATSDLRLAQAVGALLAELRDGHVSLSIGYLEYGYGAWAARPTYFSSRLVFGSYVTDPVRTPGNPLAFGHLTPTVGYVWIPSFSGSGFGPATDDALTQLQDVGAIILDVRQNLGGETRHALDVAGRFAPRSRVYAHVRYRDGPRHDDLTPWRPVTISPAGSRRFDGPVVVLTDRLTFSAAEEFVLAMRARRGVVVIGDSTGGGVGNPLVRELPNGWTYRLSQWIESTPDGVVFEEVGLAPDVWVRGSAAQLALGRDAPLDSALAVALRALAR